MPDNLSLSEEHALEILRKLEYRCERFGLYNSAEKEPPVEITFDDLDFNVYDLKKILDLESTQRYLKENGLDFSITFDFDDGATPPVGYTHQFKGKYMNAGEVPLGEIKGKSIEEIKSKIKKLLSKLRTKNNKMGIQKISATFTFSFNLSNGELSRYPQDRRKPYPFMCGKGRYKLMIVLIDAQDNDSGGYVTTPELAKAGGYRKDGKCREALHSIRDRVQEIFKEIKANEFIENKQGSGYRIGKKTSIFFQDTP